MASLEVYKVRTLTIRRDCCLIYWPHVDQHYISTIIKKPKMLVGQCVLICDAGTNSNTPLYFNRWYLVLLPMVTSLPLLGMVMFGMLVPQLARCDRYATPRPFKEGIKDT